MPACLWVLAMSFATHAVKLLKLPSIQYIEEIVITHHRVEPDPTNINRIFGRMGSEDG